MGTSYIAQIMGRSDLSFPTATLQLCPLSKGPCAGSGLLCPYANGWRQELVLPAAGCIVTRSDCRGVAAVVIDAGSGPE